MNYCKTMSQLVRNDKDKMLKNQCNALNRLRLVFLGSSNLKNTYTVSIDRERFSKRFLFEDMWYGIQTFEEMDDIVFDMITQSLTEDYHRTITEVIKNAGYLTRFAFKMTLFIFYDYCI